VRHGLPFPSLPPDRDDPRSSAKVIHEKQVEERDEMTLNDLRDEVMKYIK